MKLINHVKGTTTERVYLFETVCNAYDNSNEPIEFCEMITVFNRKYFIDDKITDEASTTIIAHRYDTVRKIKHEIVFIIDWNNLHYHYDIKKYDIG